MERLLINIGLEHERIILRSGSVANVKGCPQTELPHDTMACLAETRGHYSCNPLEAVRHFLAEQAKVDQQFQAHGLNLVHGEVELTMAEADASYEGTKKPEGQEVGFNLIRGGGLHIHFSVAANHRTELPMKPFEPLLAFQNASCLTAVLDVTMSRWIQGRSSYRKPGQFRLKPYGFEYRSLLWSGDPQELCAMALKAHVSVISHLNHIYK